MANQGDIMGRNKGNRAFDVKREVRFFQSDLDRIEAIIEARPDDELSIARVVRVAVREWLQREEAVEEDARREAYWEAEKGKTQNAFREEQELF